MSLGHVAGCLSYGKVSLERSGCVARGQGALLRSITKRCRHAYATGMFQLYAGMRHIRGQLLMLFCFKPASCSQLLLLC